MYVFKFFLNINWVTLWVIWASLVAQMVKNPPVSAGVIRDTGLIPGLGRSPAGGDGNPLQYSYPENPMETGAWWAMVHKVTESDMAEET